MVLVVGIFAHYMQGRRPNVGAKWVTPGMTSQTGNAEYRARKPSCKVNVQMNHSGNLREFFGVSSLVIIAPARASTTSRLQSLI